jgi:hypothetical protein
MMAKFVHRTLTKKGGSFHGTIRLLVVIRAKTTTVAAPQNPTILKHLRFCASQSMGWTPSPVGPTLTSLITTLTVAGAALRLLK